MLGLLNKVERSSRKIDRWLPAPRTDDQQAPSQPTVWTPNPGPQTWAYESQADELFYGGAAGGGKTDLLLGLAGTQHWRSIIFRREFPQLRDVVERSRVIYNSSNASHAKDSYNESLHLWRLISGQIVEFGAMQYEKDREDYRGRPHDFYGWDELPQFTESQYRFVNTWARSTHRHKDGRPQRVRIVGAGNPPSTSEGEWVIAYWAPWLDDQHPHKAQPGELRWYARIDNKDVMVESNAQIDYKGEVIKPRSRTFIPALLSDNPILAATEYGAQLQALEEPFRSQLLFGNFTIRANDDAYQAIPTAWVKSAQARWQKYGRPTGVGLSRGGLDVARGGGDNAVFAPRYKHFVDSLIRWPGATVKTGPPLVAKLVEWLISNLIATDKVETRSYPDDNVTIPLVECPIPISIDIIGVGSSPYDIARAHGIKAQGINWGEGSKKRHKSGRYGFINKRAEDIWGFREWLDPSTFKRQDGTPLPEEEQPMLPPDSQLLSDLCSYRWKVVGDDIQIESKDDIKKRINRSPDAGEAVILSRSEGRATSVLFEV